MKIFDESSLRKLEQLTLVADRVRVGVMKGERRSRKRGTSIEFADYRNYTRGDDLRRLDWNVFARLERPFIKLLEEEEDLGVHLLVDSSLSMDWPDEDAELNKLNYAVRMAGALAHIGLAAGDQVTVTLMRSTGNDRWGPFRGRHNTLRLLQFLENGRASGITDLNLALRNYALQSRRPGLLFVLSDLFSPSGYREGLNALQSRGYEVGLLHILSPDETDPPIGGDVKLVDIETGADAEITLDNSTVDLYHERFQEWQTEVGAYCQGRGVHYVPITTDYPWDRLVMQTLRAKGLVS
ncbi:MAG: DUF58 domain-containing protein [Candidatus Promineifilaceae bacterium]